MRVLLRTGSFDRASDRVSERERERHIEREGPVADRDFGAEKCRDRLLDAEGFEELVFAHLEQSPATPVTFSPTVRLKLSLLACHPASVQG